MKYSKNKRNTEQNVSAERSQACQCRGFLQAARYRVKQFWNAPLFYVYVYVYGECIYVSCWWCSCWLGRSSSRAESRMLNAQSPNRRSSALLVAARLVLRSKTQRIYRSARRAPVRLWLDSGCLWALERHIGKSFWQNCGSKGARYCIG